MLVIKHVAERSVSSVVFVLWQGYSHNEEFIVTQHPLDDTVSDFWNMIWDQNSIGIVLLSTVDDVVSSFPVYFDPVRDVIWSILFYSVYRMVLLWVDRVVSLIMNAVTVGNVKVKKIVHGICMQFSLMNVLKSTMF